MEVPIYMMLCCIGVCLNEEFLKMVNSKMNFKMGCAHLLDPYRISVAI